MKIIPTKPVWGETLQAGYCGFITREKDFVGDGIEWFERFEEGLPFVHTFVVEGPVKPAGMSDIEPRLAGTPTPPSAVSAPPISIIEAHAGTGVHRATLDEYLGQRDCQCFIRMPIGWTAEIGEKIVAGASAHLGEKYAFSLIFADAVTNTLVGHWINQLTFSVPDRFLCWVLSDAHRKICSQLVALALQSQFYLRLRGCLRHPADTIMPKELGNDASVWDAVIYKIS